MWYSWSKSLSPGNSGSDVSISLKRHPIAQMSTGLRTQPAQSEEWTWTWSECSRNDTKRNYCTSQYCILLYCTFYCAFGVLSRFKHSSGRDRRAEGQVSPRRHSSRPALLRWRGAPRRRELCGRAMGGLRAPGARCASKPSGTGPRAANARAQPMRTRNRTLE